MAEEPKRKRRDLLKQYYQLEEKKQAAATAQVETADPQTTFGTVGQLSLDPTNLDSPGFEAPQYFSNLLRTETFSGIAHAHKHMNTEISELDTKMKNLVYDNYSKFIDATETIKVMKKNVENMEDEMNRLSQNMSTITTCATSINNTLGVRRTKIDNLTQVNQLLKKLQFLVDLPARLRKSIEIKAYATAVQYYKATASILRRYSDLPTFQQIEKESAQIMKDLQLFLDAELKKSDLKSSIVVEYARLLLELGEDPVLLRQEYLQGRRKSLKQALESFTVGERS